jgi:3-phosphoshikimate 1-carboxyvinyltransferase
LIPVAAALGIEAVFTGEGTLKERPVDLYADLFKEKNVKIEFCDGKIPVKISGRLSAGKFFIPGNITSQFATGLMFALPLLSGNSEIILTSPLESAPYADMTADVLKSFGVVVQKTLNGYYINGGQHYMSATYIVEGDFTQAAYFACAAAINGDVTIKRLNLKSMQGDCRIIDILREFGAKVYFEGNVLRALRGNGLKGIKIDASDIPDLIPVLSVVAAYAQGETVIYNAKRLRLKESDRILTICEMLKSIGANAEKTDDGLVIHGSAGEKLMGGYVKSFNDHRIAMAAAVAGIKTKDGVAVDDMSCINKSYPMFLKDFEGLG